MKQPFGEKLLERIEHASALDKIADAVSKPLRAVIRPGAVQDTLSGTPIGHPAHPAVVTIPIGAWTATSMLDLTGTDQRAIGRVQGIGILGALPAAASGATDWLSTLGAERRVGLVHAGLNYTGLSLHIASWVARRRGRTASARVLGWAGTSVVGLSGWLGGHLSYAQGVGVDTTVFEALPTEWTDLAADADVPAQGAVCKSLDGVPLLLARVGGRVVAYADRCTHRGGPLHEGEIANGCVRCPWHDSVFDLSDGSVVSGPASRPQPKLDVEIRGGRVHVRRQEQRSLRTNPVGS